MLSEGATVLLEGILRETEVPSDWRLRRTEVFSEGTPRGTYYHDKILEEQRNLHPQKYLSNLFKEPSVQMSKRRVIGNICGLEASCRNEFVFSESPSQPISRLQAHRNKPNHTTLPIRLAL